MTEEGNRANACQVAFAPLATTFSSEPPAAKRASCSATNDHLRAALLSVDPDECGDMITLSSSQKGRVEGRMRSLGPAG